MKMFKKLLSFIIVASVLTCILPVVSYANKGKTVNSIEIVNAPERTDYYYEVSGYKSYYDNSTYDENSGEYISESYDYFVYSIDSYGLKIKINYSNGDSIVTDDFYSLKEQVYITGQDNGEIWEVGTHAVTVKYMGKTATFNVNVIDNPVESINIVKLPNKLNYYLGVDGYDLSYQEVETDEFGNDIWVDKEYFDYNIDTDGLKLKYNLKDGSSVIGDLNEFENSFNMDSQGYGETWGIGKHLITIEVMNQKIEYQITILENPVKDIEIIKLPDKTKYVQGVDSYKYTYTEYDYENCDENGNPTEIDVEYDYYNVDTYGLKLKVNYTDGTNKIIDYCYYDDNYNIDYEGQKYGEVWGIGSHNVEITFMGRSATYSINVIENPVKGIEFTKLNTKDSYIKGELVDICGSSLKVYFKDGTSKEYILLNYSKYGDWFYGEGEIDGYQWCLLPSIADDNSAIDYSFTYMGCETNFRVTNSNLRITKLDFLSQPNDDEGTGAKIKLSLSDSTSFDAEVLDFGKNLCDIFYKKGFFKTDKGIFAGYNSIENLCDVNNATYTFGICLNSSESDDIVYTTKNFKNVFASKKAELMFDLIRCITGDFENSPKIWFDGTIDKNNIDLIIETSIYLILISDNSLYSIDADMITYTASQVNSIVSQIFAVDSVDIKSSKNYNAETGLYEMPLDGFGSSGAYKFDVENIGGLIYVHETENSDTGTSNFYTVFDENCKCLYAGTVKKIINNAVLHSVDIQSSISMNINSTAKIIPNIIVDDGLDYEVTFSSSNPSVASVDNNGNINSKKEGISTITCTVTDSFGNMVSDTCKVTVTATPNSEDNLNNKTEDSTSATGNTIINKDKNATGTDEYKNNNSSSQPSEYATNPKTGENNIIMCAVLLLVSASAILVLSIYTKRKQKEENNK